MGSQPQGTKHWNCRDAYFCQDNNPTEHLLKVLDADERSWLETCGPTAAVNCLAALGRPLSTRAPGGYCPPPEQLLCDFFHDSSQFPFLRNHWAGANPEDVAAHRFAQWYPGAVSRVFGAKAEFVGAMSTDQAIERLERGQALQVCLKKPGHYVAVVAHSPEEKAFVINDPWAARWPDGSGWNKRLSETDFAINTKPVGVAYE